MKTRQSISTISYNSFDFLRDKLMELFNAHIIEFFAFIEHEPEEDEVEEAGPGKRHMHVFIQPAKDLQTEELRDELKEYDPNNPGKPLGCLPFKKTKKWEDWYLYAIHDRVYLRTKGQDRRIIYSMDMIVSSDYDYLYYLVKNIDYGNISKYLEIITAINEGQGFSDYAIGHNVPIQQFRQFKDVWFSLGGQTKRTKKSKRHFMSQIEDKEA